MSDFKAGKAFVLYRLLSVALDLRTFGSGEMESLAGVPSAEVEKFIAMNIERGFLRPEKSGRVSVNSHAFEVLATEAVSSSREVLRAIVRQLKSRKRPAPRRRIEQVSNRATGHFHEALLIAARTESLLLGALPKINIGRAKASRIAMEEFKRGLLSEDDINVIEKIESPPEDELYFEYGDEEIIDPDSRIRPFIRLPLLGNEGS